MEESTTSEARGGNDSDLSPLLSSFSSLRIDAGRPTGQSGPSRGEDPVQGPSQTPTQRIKFLINVPMWVPLPDSDHPQEEIMNQCQRLLTLLEQTGFSEIDKQHLVDVAVIIGLNGKDSPDLRKLLGELFESNEETDLKKRFQKVTYTWGPMGNIKYKKKAIPYQDIREYLKNHEETKKLARELRGDDECLVYFSFIDGDTQDFNHVYSYYLEIVKKHSEDHAGVPPTVMSTGYEFPVGDEFQPASQIDRKIRILTAEHFPLGTYYPEPNFCVLLPLGADTLPESFISKDLKQNMESPTLIKDVKKRINFTSLFVKGNPVITAAPAKCKLSKDKWVTSPQSHYTPYVWATSALIHGEVNYGGKRGDFGKMRGVLMRMLKHRTDEEFEKEKLAVRSNGGPGVEQLISAALAVREYRQQLEQSQKEKERDENMKGIMKEFKLLKEDNAKKDQQIRTLTSRMDEIDQLSKINDVIITGLKIKHRSSARAAGLEKEREENTASVEQQALKAMEEKGIKIEQTEVDTCYLLPKKKGDGENGTCAVMLKFTSKKSKTALLKQREKLRESQVFINEHLTRANASIAWKARQLKKAGKIQQTWTANCRVFIKANGDPEQTKPVPVREMEELAKFDQ